MKLCKNDRMEADDITDDFSVKERTPILEKLDDSADSEKECLIKKDSITPSDVKRINVHHSSKEM